jgi:SEL1 protein
VSLKSDISQSSFDWQLTIFCAVIFASFIALCSARKESVQSLATSSTSLDHTTTSTAWSDSNSAQAEPDNNRSADVREAEAILRKISVSTGSSFARFGRKPKGFLGNVLHYGKELLVLLFMNSPKQSGPLSNADARSRLSQPLAQAVKLLEDAANDDDADAIFLLAEMNFYGNFSHPIVYDVAFEGYEHLAQLDGNTTAQYMVGFMYATGLAPSVPSDHAKSMLYHTFAAEAGNTRSEMTLGYRYLSGVATPRNCDEAVHWYKRVADKAIRYYRSGPPGGRSLDRDAYKIVDDLGGVYGEGASVSSSGLNAKRAGPTSDAYAHVDDVLEYLYLQSSKGDLTATFGLARLYYEGARGLKRDFKLAKKYFKEVARAGWTDKGRQRKDVDKHTEKYASKAAGYLGWMFLRGEGMEQSFAKAKIWFTRGISNADALSQYSLGLMYLEGHGVDQDVAKAADYLAAAADQELPVAQTHLGMLFLDQGDVYTAGKYFDLAARLHHIEAFYYLAEMNEQGVGRDRSCRNAAIYYKIVAEKAEAIWSSLAEAATFYEDGDTERALIGYLMAAEQGSENAQANVAWLLEQNQPRSSLLSRLLSTVKRTTQPVGDAALALIHWTRSAKQQNIDSLVKMGDYHLQGLGTEASPENAAACYQAASESSLSAQAMWNLGWMHENGVGIEKDFHLAKRYYDLALNTNLEAYVPVQLSLFRLRWRSWWNRITHGSVNGIQDDQPERRSLSFAEWISAFLEADQLYQQEHYEADDWESDHDHMPGEDYFDDGYEDDSMIDTLILGGLVAALGWLLWYRQQQRRRAVEQQRVANGGAPNDDAQQEVRQPAQQNDGGFFPQPGDPARNDWAVGGIGL